MTELLAQRPDYTEREAADLFLSPAVAAWRRGRAAGDEITARLAYQQTLDYGGAVIPARPMRLCQQLQPATPGQATKIKGLRQPQLGSRCQRSSLNLRLGPGTDFPILGQLSADSRLALLGRDEAGDWLVVCCVDKPEPGWGGGAPGGAPDTRISLGPVGGSPPHARARGHTDRAAPANGYSHTRSGHHARPHSPAHQHT